MSRCPFLVGTRSIFDPFTNQVWEPFTSSEACAADAKVDWKETPEAHIFKVDLPGLKKHEVKVEVDEGRVLQISGERSKEEEDKDDKWHRVERSKEKEDKWHRVERGRGKFLRRFQLPANAKIDEVKATMEDGVLTVIIPKEEIKKPEVKTIEISGH